MTGKLPDDEMLDRYGSYYPAGHGSTSPVDMIHDSLKRLTQERNELLAERDRLLEEKRQLLGERSTLRDATLRLEEARNALKEQFQAQATEVPKLLAERNQYKADLQAEFDGNRVIRKRFGAKDHETFLAFIARLVAERDSWEQTANDLESRNARQYRTIERLEAERDALRGELAQIVHSEDFRVTRLTAERDRLANTVLESRKLLEGIGGDAPTLIEQVRHLVAKLGELLPVVEAAVGLIEAEEEFLGVFADVAALELARDKRVRARLALGRAVKAHKKVEVEG